MGRVAHGVAVAPVEGGFAGPERCYEAKAEHVGAEAAKARVRELEEQLRA